MSWGEVDYAPDLTGGFRQAAAQDAKSSQGLRREMSPFTLRLTREERDRLEELAAGMTLSAYMRACVFAEDAKLRKSRSANAVVAKKAIAEVLALLGQTRIASNLNQLAHHANLGILIESEETKAQIAEANAHLLAIRTALMTALGKRATSSGSNAAKNTASRFARTRSGLGGDVLFPGDCPTSGPVGQI